MKITPFLISFVLSLYINLQVFSDHYVPVLAVLWVTSIFLLIIPFVKDLKLNFKKIEFSRYTLFVILIIILPALVRIISYSLNRIHGDDMITAYFSATYDFTKINFFSGIPTAKVDWVARFPASFFILQRMFFNFFGQSLLSIKLSVIPYIFITSLFLFLSVKEIFNKKTAAISVILYSYFAISLYFETLGLHFIGSSAMFMIFFYSVIKMKENKNIYSIGTGITLGLCFLFYTTSYIALPLFFVFMVFHLLWIRKKIILKNYLLAFFAFLIVISPYFTYAYKFDNYFTSRMEQVSLLTGSWSGEKDKIKRGESPLVILKDNFIKTIKSLYFDGYGGHGGYTFANLALFEKYSFYLYILGFFISIVFILKKIESLSIILITITSFLTIVLSIPPPAFQRFSIAFPFITITSSLPLYSILSFNKINLKIRYLVTIVLIIIYAFSNQKYFLRSIQKELTNQELELSSFINNNFPDRNIYVASFPGYNFEKIYYFSPQKNAQKIMTEYHDNVIKKFNPQEKYVYVILFPNQFNDTFIKLDKDGRIIKFSDRYSLFVN